MQFQTMMNGYRCDKCQKECRRSELGMMLHIRDVKPLIRDEKVSITKHYCNPCADNINNMLSSI